jgi:hypothetical protein
MKKFLLSLLLLAGAILPASAQQRTEAEARAIANAFMQNNGYDFAITKSAKINKVRTEKAGEITPYYIFNDTQKGGFVIVGGQEAMSDILAYSNEDCFDVDDMPPAAKFILGAYAEAAVMAADYPEKSMAEKKAAAKSFKASGFTRRHNVAPLLGEIKYNQGRPYNILCPRITETTIQGGKKSIKTDYPATGCTNTAMAMLMRYWKWPVRPNVQKTYTFSYETVFNNDNNTKTYDSMEMSIDYDKEPAYDWDNMLPRYESLTFSTTAHQDSVVARLMLHCGISNQASYGLGGTGAALRPAGLVTHFGYANDWISDSYGNYKNVGWDAYRAMFADELSSGRVIWAAGSGESAAHSYIIDGYDLNGLFHFNLGWNGGSNGYYEVAPNPTAPYGLSMYFYRHIHPLGRFTPSDPTRRIVLEIGYGDHNTKTKSTISALKALDVDGKIGDSMICIATADTEEDAENHLPGLSTIEGILFNRCDTFTGTMSQKQVTYAYLENYNKVSPAMIDIDAMYSSDSTMAVTVYTEFPNAHTDANYRIAFVYTEDEVKIDGTTYNSIARGMYPNKDGYENCIPSTIEPETEYIFENEIPIPASISKTNNTTLIAMLIDGKTGEIVNANTVDLKQIATWRANQKPAFYNEGKILQDSTQYTTYKFDEIKSRMVYPIRINNPLYEKMPVEVSVEAIDLAENAQIQLGETGGTTMNYYLNPNTVDSTMMLYLNINDKYSDSKSVLKLTLKYKDNVIAQQIVNFDFYKSVPGFNAYTIRQTGTLHEIISDEAQDTLTILTLGGRICGKDIIYLRDSLNLKVLDMSQAHIAAGPGNYYSDFLTENDIVGVRLFAGMEAQTIILPESATEIANYVFYQNKKLTKAVIGKNVTSIGNYAFSGCKALERITIPASVKNIDRQAFKDCPLVCVICEGETPATVGSKAFDSDALPTATLVVPSEEAIAAYKAANVWKNFGNIISYDQYLTNIAPATETVAVTVKDGNIIVAEDAEVAIYTFAGKLIVKGGAGEYAVPAGSYIVKVGNKAVKVRL